MALPINRPFQETAVYARTTSIGGGTAGSSVVWAKGKIQRVYAFSEGASTGTISIAVAVNGGSTIATMTMTGGANAIASAEIALPVDVQEGDLVTFTPSGGGGSNIPGHFYAIIR